jgi:hypothetical protein
MDSAKATLSISVLIMSKFTFDQLCCAAPLKSSSTCVHQQQSQQRHPTPACKAAHARSAVLRRTSVSRKGSPLGKHYSCSAKLSHSCYWWCAVELLLLCVRISL